ncbi:MAG: discoidin domain-containing protein [Armatimonadota bacterium]
MIVIDLQKDSLAVNPVGIKGSVIWKSAELFAREIQERTGDSVVIDDKQNSVYTLTIGITDDDSLDNNVKNHSQLRKLKDQGFWIYTSLKDKKLFVIGEDQSGAMAGVGKLLRMIRYEQGKISVPNINLISNPEMPVRGMYFATHFGNFYEEAPLEKIDKVIEDLALWGCNHLNVWFDMHQFNGINDPSAKKLLARLWHMGNTAHSVGMKFGLTSLANEGYANSPVELRIPVKNPGSYGVEMCPSIPEGMERIVSGLEEMACQFPKVDSFWIWPYDQGGCWCDKCLPWGGNGYIRASEKIAEAYLKHFPNAEIWLSSWKMDYFGNTQGEIDGLVKYMKDKKPQWLTGIITGQDEYETQKALMNRPNPKRYPLASFPEISMYGMFPWGGFGASPLPEFNSKVAGLMRDTICGGWPYSEGIYEDLAKFQWLSFYWSPDRNTDDVLKEYASYYLNSDVADDFVKLSYMLEKTHYRHNWWVKSLDEAPAAWELTQSIDSRLADWSKKSWRWRLMYDRAGIDSVLAKHPATDPKAQAALEPFCEEIVEICHLQNTHLRPPDFPQKTTGNNLAFGKNVTASSTLPGYEGSAKFLVDGYLPHDSPQSFWVNDPSKEKTSSIVIDLGESKQINEIRLQFREINGKYMFIPSNVTFSVSDDNIEFYPLSILYIDPNGGVAGPYVSTVCVPAEDSDFVQALWRYKLVGSKQCRYIRIDLGASQRTNEPYLGIIELTEVEVSGL